jgi:RHS repeat-associated protein
MISPSPGCSACGTESPTFRFLAPHPSSPIMVVMTAAAAAALACFSPRRTEGRTPSRRNSHQAPGRFWGRPRVSRYCRARYYHPGFARFISEDPIREAGGDLNLYGYVLGNPLVRRDPRGLEFTTGFTYGYSAFAGLGYGVAGGVATLGGIAFGPNSVSLGGSVAGGGAIGGPGFATGVPPEGQSQDAFILGIGASKIGPGFLLSNASSFSEFNTGTPTTTTLYTIGILTLQADEAGGTFAFSVSPALGLGYARYRTGTAVAGDIPIVTVPGQDGQQSFAVPIRSLVGPSAIGRRK